MSKVIKPGSYCSIQAYISATDSVLADILDKTCTLDMLSRVIRNWVGVTFLMPVADHPIRNELIKLIESTDPSNLRKAADIIQSFIIRDYIPSASDWKKTDDIANAMFPSKKVIVKSVDGTSVSLEGDGGVAKISKDAGYKDGSRRSNMVVWKLESGVPSTKTPDAVIKKPKKPIKGKEGKYGGYMPSNEEILSLRFQIGVDAENEQLLSILQNKHEPCMTYYAAGLVQYIKSADHDLYLNILPLLQRDESDFYILVEPHLPPGQNPIVPDSNIEGWWSNPAKQCANYNSYCAEICADLDKSMPDRSGVLDAVTNLRSTFNGDYQAADKLYDEVCGKNAVGGHKYYNDYLADYYGNGRSYLKKLHDELRYVIPLQFKNANDFPTFKEIVQWIGQRMYRPQSSNLFKHGSKVFATFANSSAFLYVPCTVEEMRSRSKATTDIQRAIDKDYFMANDFLSYERHRRLVDQSMQAQFGQLIGLLKGGALTQEQKNELVKFISHPD